MPEEASITKQETFLRHWFEQGFNATKAYRTLHPGVSYASARTLGARMLAKVDISDLLAAEELSVACYVGMIKEGLKAKKPGGNPDYQTRIYFHTVLGRLLGME